MASATANLRSIRKDLLALPRATRALLAQELLESLDEGTEEIEKEWAIEADPRYKEKKSGKVKCVPGKEVLGRVRNRFK